RRGEDRRPLIRRGARPGAGPPRGRRRAPRRLDARAAGQRDPEPRRELRRGRRREEGGRRRPVGPLRREAGPPAPYSGPTVIVYFTGSRAETTAAPSFSCVSKSCFRSASTDASTPLSFAMPSTSFGKLLITTLIMPVSKFCFVKIRPSSFLNASEKGLSKNSAARLIPFSSSSFGKDFEAVPNVTFALAASRFFTTSVKRLR